MPASAATGTINPDGSVLLEIGGTQDLGTGTRTAITGMVAAETLGLPLGASHAAHRQ